MVPRRSFHESFHGNDVMHPRSVTECDRLRLSYQQPVACKAPSGSRLDRVVSLTSPCVFFGSITRSSAAAICGCTFRSVKDLITAIETCMGLERPLPVLHLDQDRRRTAPALPPRQKNLVHRY